MNEQQLKDNARIERENRVFKRNPNPSHELEVYGDYLNAAHTPMMTKDFVGIDFTTNASKYKMRRMTEQEAQEYFHSISLDTKECKKNYELWK
jgi:hypothetical protein